MVEKSITGIVTWLKQWFYDRGDIDEKVQQLNTSIGTKVSSNLGSANMNVVTGSNNMVTLEAKNNHSHGALTSDGKVGTVSGRVVTTGTDGVIQASSSVSASLVKDNTAHSHIGSSANASQSSINSAIDSALASLEGDITNLASMDVVNVVSALPRQIPTSEDLNKLYIVVNENSADVYYAELHQISGSQSEYIWRQMDTEILDDLSIDWSDIENNPFSSASPSDYATSTHSHGDDIDWSYNSNGFVNGIKLHDKTSTGDDATGTITFHLKS